MPEMPDIASAIDKVFKRKTNQRLEKLESEVNLLRVEVLQLRQIVKETLSVWHDLGFLDPACKEPPNE